MSLRRPAARQVGDREGDFLLCRGVEAAGLADEVGDGQRRPATTRRLESSPPPALPPSSDRPWRRPRRRGGSDRPGRRRPGAAPSGDRPSTMTPSSTTDSAPVESSWRTTACGLDASCPVPSSTTPGGNPHQKRFAVSETMTGSEPRPPRRPTRRARPAPRTLGAVCDARLPSADWQKLQTRWLSVDEAGRAAAVDANGERFRSAGRAHPPRHTPGRPPGAVRERPAGEFERGGVPPGARRGRPGVVVGEAGGGVVGETGAARREAAPAPTGTGSRR